MAEGTPVKLDAPVEQTAELVKRMCLAQTNVEMFGHGHPVASKDIRYAYDCLHEILERRKAPLILTVSERSILIDRLPLEDRNPLVVKFAGRLGELHVSSLVLEPGVSAGEFESFYGILARGPRAINAQGGLGPLMDQAGLRGIRLREIGYVMVGEDERVVSRDAKVVEEASGGGDSDLARHMVSRLLQKAEEQQWLLAEMKNNPQRMTDLISEGIDLAVSRQEAGLSREDGTIEALLHNIKLVGQSLVDREAAPGEATEDLDRAVMRLESELRLRSSKLMSSKVSQGFLNEILAVISSYSDRIRAKRITNEFLKGEDSLKRAEKLLKELVPDDTSREATLNRLAAMLQERGMAENDIRQLVDGAREDGKPKPRRPRRPYSRPVADGVLKRLKDMGLTPEQEQKIVDSVSAYVEERARDKASESRAELDRLAAESSRRGVALDAVPWGIVLWGPGGEPDFLNAAAREILGADDAPALGDPLRNALASWSFPLTDLPDAAEGLGLHEMKLLTAAVRALRDGGGAVFGVLLMPPKA